MVASDVLEDPLLLIRLAAHPRTPAPAIDALVQAAVSPARYQLAAALLQRADLSDDHTDTLLARPDTFRAFAALRRPALTAQQAARALRPFAPRIPAAVIGQVPHLPDPDGVLAAALGDTHAAHRHTLYGPDPNPDALTRAALALAGARLADRTVARRIAAVWHTRPDLRDQLTAAAAHVRSDTATHLGVLTAAAGSDPDAREGSVQWFAHPARTAEQAAAYVLTHRSGRVWSRALTWTHDPDHVLARTIVTAAYLADQPLTTIARDTTRPVDVRAGAVAALVHAHARRAAAHTALEAVLEASCVLEVADHLPSAAADAVAATCEQYLVHRMLARPDTGPDRLAVLTDNPNLTVTWRATTWATHPAASRAQRAAAARALEGTCPGPDLPVAHAAATCGPAAAGLGLPIAPAEPRGRETRELHGLLIDAALDERAPHLTFDATGVLCDLAPTFTGTVGQLLDVVATVAA